MGGSLSQKGNNLMKYYAYIQNGNINGVGSVPQITDGVKSVEIPQTVYNNIEQYTFDGKEIVLNPDYEAEQVQKKREELDKLSLTKREVFLVLYKDKKITPDQLKAQIEDAEALIEFEYANDYFRGNPLINLIGEKLGYTTDELDHLFETGELPAKDDVNNFKADGK